MSDDEVNSLIEVDGTPTVIVKPEPETKESEISSDDIGKIPDIIVTLETFDELPVQEDVRSEDIELDDSVENKPKEESDEKPEAESDKPVKKKHRKSKDDDYDPDRMKEKLRRAYLIHKKDYVRLRTFSRDNSTGEFHLDTTLVKRSDLPRKAVACTGERHTYCLDLVKDSPWYIENHYKNYLEKESQFTAADAALYMQSNKIDNALAINWTSMSHVNPMKYMVLAAGGLLIVLFMIMRL